MEKEPKPVNSMLDVLNELIRTGKDLKPDHDNYVDPNLVSDGYHTFGELYEHRFTNFMMLCAFVNLYTVRGVWKSKFHHDGTGYPGWFIMGINTEKGHQIRYHLPEKYWDEADMAATIDKAPEWDGHTSEQVLERIKKLL